MNTFNYSLRYADGSAGIDAESITGKVESFGPSLRRPASGNREKALRHPVAGRVLASLPRGFVRLIPEKCSVAAANESARMQVMEQLERLEVQATADGVSVEAENQVEANSVIEALRMKIHDIVFRHGETMDLSFVAED